MWKQRFKGVQGCLGFLFCQRKSPLSSPFSTSRPWGRAATTSKEKMMPEEPAVMGSNDQYSHTHPMAFSSLLWHFKTCWQKWEQEDKKTEVAISLKGECWYINTVKMFFLIKKRKESLGQESIRGVTKIISKYFLCTRHCCKNLRIQPLRTVILLLLLSLPTDEKTEARRGTSPCPRTPS